MTRWLALGGVVIGLASPASAQVLTLADATTEAVARNPSLRQARASLDQAGARAGEARAAFLPQITFSESWQRGTQPVFAFGALLSARAFTSADFAVDRLNHPGATSMFAAAIRADQVVFDGGRVRAHAAGAAHARDAARADLDAAAAGTVVAVTRFYGRIVIGDAAVRAALGAVSAAEEDAARAERRRVVGTVTDADVLAVAVHLADVRRQLIEARGEAALARAELNRLTGAPIDRVFEVVSPAPPAAGPIDLPALLAEADRARPELQRAAAAEAMATSAARAARAGWMPQVVARAGYDLIGLTLTDRAGAWIAGGEVTWRLSLGGAEWARRRAASAAIAVSEAAREDARAAVHVEVLSAVRRLEAADAKLEVGRHMLDQAREAQRILRNRYEAGVAGIADVLRAAATVLDAERQRTASAVDVLVAHAELQRAVGRPSGPPAK